MLTIKSPVLTEKGALKPSVRKEIRDVITDLKVEFANGTVVSLDNKGNGNYFGLLANCADGTKIYGKVEFVITTNEYKEPTKRPAKPKEKEPVVIE